MVLILLDLDLQIACEAMEDANDGADRVLSFMLVRRMQLTSLYIVSLRVTQ